MTKIAVLVGSLRQDSFNKKLATTIEAAAPEGVEFNYVDLNMPLFNEELEGDLPSEVVAAKDVVDAADGVIFVTPEYNRGTSGVLKNAIDWISRPYGKSSFVGKPAGIVGASISPLGTAVAQSDLRQIAAHLDMKLIGQPEVYLANAFEHFDEQGNADEATQARAKKYIDTFLAWIDQQK